MIPPQGPGTVCQANQPGGPNGPCLGPIHWPSATVTGAPYNKDDVNACLGALHHGGGAPAGSYGVDVRVVNNLSILGGNAVVDRSTDHLMVIINAINIIGAVEFQLLNPNALYCIRSLSILELVKVTSCHPTNVVFGDNLQILSVDDVDVVDCH